MKKLVTFYIDTKVLDRFRKLCESKGMIMSKRVQMMIEKEVKEK